MELSGVYYTYKDVPFEINRIVIEENAKRKIKDELLKLFVEHPSIRLEWITTS